MATIINISNYTNSKKASSSQVACPALAYKTLAIQAFLLLNQIFSYFCFLLLAKSSIKGSEILNIIDINL
ncbi:hypothetical protein A4S05_10220 [Nostoc sp. KVJ20]|uniref:hypothetical protein n=1 Tax=Nostoc sp. KVJ20 TaxID=457944 RepID=UPI00083DB8ED|nr:hypothetical protein [Nostoc sp. KVJ20]ODG98209.1 hypothetical protein A4S05_10220 [Nostoc sp. KVJ20]